MFRNEEFSAAYAAIGFKPQAWHFVSSDKHCCALSAILLARKLASEQELRELEELEGEYACGWLAQRLELGKSEVRGFIAGFDFAGFEPSLGSVYEESYDRGVAVAAFIEQEVGCIRDRIS